MSMFGGRVIMLRLSNLGRQFESFKVKLNKPENIYMLCQIQRELNTIRNSDQAKNIFNLKHTKNWVSYKMQLGVKITLYKVNQ